MIKTRKVVIFMTSQKVESLPQKLAYLQFA